MLSIRTLQDLGKETSHGIKKTTRVLLGETIIFSITFKQYSNDSDQTAHMRSLIRVIAILKVQNNDTVVYPSFLRTFAPGVRHLVYIFIDGGRFTGQCHGDGLWATNIFSLFSSPGAINLSFFSSCQKPETSCMHKTCYMYMYTNTFLYWYIAPPTLLRVAAYFWMII